MGLEVGAGNPGTTALNYLSNNTGSVHDVQISSDDGKGQTGIDLTRQWAGPLLIRNTEIRGFNVGIDLNNAEYSSTLEDITLENQNIVGIRNANQPISIRGLFSANLVPALTNTGGFVVLIDANLVSGSPNNFALQTNSTMYLRNVTSSGYQATLQNTSGTSPSLTVGTISEYLVGAPLTLTGSLSNASLNLSIEETPSYTSPDLSDWATFIPNFYGDTSGLQAILNSGKSTVYFPFGRYFSYAEAAVTVPETVNRIVGFSSVVNGSAGGLNGGGMRLVVTGNSTQPLITEQFGYGLKIDHQGSRPVVIKDALVTYTDAPGAGNLFLEDVEVAQPLVVQTGQKVWARQLNDEVMGTKISNLGGSLWILGLKTEHAGTVIDTESSGQTELLGSLIYPASYVPSTDAAFSSTDAQVSYMYSQPVYCTSCGYSIQVQETRDGNTLDITSSGNKHYRMPLFIGYK